MTLHDQNATACLQDKFAHMAT